MRRKSSNNNFNPKRRNSQGRSGHQPRRNYGAAREKYLAQARDALSSGDRVMAEYYYQHAEHCFRMLAEEGQRHPRPQHHQGRPHDMDHTDELPEDSAYEESAADQLPAFITSGQPIISDEVEPAAAADGKK
ncbi:MAG: DUF4167 domain-containing protein [Alphaproteobacteria bacterium]